MEYSTIEWMTVNLYMYMTEMNDVDGSMYYQCERCGSVKDADHNHRHVPLCNRCRTPMTLRVIEQLDLGLEFPDEVTLKKAARPRFQLIEGGKV